MWHICNVCSHKKEKKKDKDREKDRDRDRKEDRDRSRDERERSSSKKKKSKDKERDRDRKSDSEKGDVKVWSQHRINIDRIGVLFNILQTSQQLLHVTLLISW